MTSQTSQPEFERRIASVRKELAGRNLDALIVFSQKRSHVRYLSGYHPNYHTNSALILLPLKKDPILWIKFGFDLSRAQAASWVQDIRVAPFESNQALIIACGQAVRELHLENARIGIAASDLAVDEMSVSLQESVRTEMPSVQIEPASEILNSIRAIKSPEEVGRMRESARIADRVVDALKASIKPGESDLNAVVAAESAARREGAHCDVIVSTDASLLAFPPSNSTFHDNSIVTCEITIELNGYWIQVCRTLSVGKPSEVQEELFRVSQRAYQAGIAAARPGNTSAHVWNTIQNSISRDGYGEFVQYGMGHGVGLDLPEMYPVDHDCNSLLPENMVLVIHPGIWVPQKGAAWTGGPILVNSSASMPLDQPQSEIIRV